MATRERVYLWLLSLCALALLPILPKEARERWWKGFERGRGGGLVQVAPERDSTRMAGWGAGAGGPRRIRR